MIRRASFLAAVVALALQASSGLQAQSTVLGGNGEIYRVRRGVYGQLVPDAPAADAGNVALVLEVAAQDGGIHRYVVPGTEGPESEDVPAIALDRDSDTVYVVWAGRRNIHSTLNIIGYRADGWTEPVEFSGNPYSTKTSPQLAVTTDRYARRGAAGEPTQQRSRTVFHLVWWDDGGDGSRILYAPLVLQPEGGAQAEGVYSLAGLLGDTGAEGMTAPPAWRPSHASPPVPTTRAS